VPADSADSEVWDIFICHATEDKHAVVEPLATALQSEGLSVWYDLWVLQLGDDLRQQIDNGLKRCRFGVVVVSPAFLRRKAWTERELGGLTQRESDG
jgi:TIR domain